METLLKSTEAARLLGVHRFTLSRWIKSGTISATSTAGGWQLIAPSELRRYLRSKGQAIPPELLKKDGRMRLLLVDDDELVLRALKRHFKSATPNVDVTTTTNGMDALLLLADTRPDVMLIDLHMKELNGFEVCRRVRTFPSLASIQLVMMTGLDFPHLDVEARRAGALGCLRKPFTPEQVLEFLQNAPTASPTEPAPSSSRARSRKGASADV